MKKTLVIISIVFSFLMQANGQVEKGTFLLGGYANVSFDTDGDYDFSINPNLGIFLGEHLCLGASTPIIFYSYTTHKSYYVGVSPFMRYYFGDNDRSRLFGLATVNLKVNNNIGIKNRGWVDLGVGYVWFVNNSVGLEAEFISNFSPETISAGLYLGFQIYFNK